MLTGSGPKVLEYNVRFGDPETQALVLLLSEDTDLAAIILVWSHIQLKSPPNVYPCHVGLRRTTTGFRGNKYPARLCRFCRFSFLGLSWQL